MERRHLVRYLGSRGREDPFVASMLAVDPSPWWNVIVSNAGPILTGAAALVASITAVRSIEGKRHRTQQQREVVGELDTIKSALAAATKQRDEIGGALTAEQKRCSEEAAALRKEIERQNATTTELLRMVRR